MKTILYIEDELFNLRLIERCLKGTEYQLMTAADAHRGLEMAQSAKPDLILLDLHMPGMSGLEVAQAIRQNAELGTTRIVFFTADTDSYPQVRDYCDAFLTKPMNKALLLRTIKEQLTPATSS